MFSLWRKLFDTDKVSEQIHCKHFKTNYGGKPTKRYLRLLRKIQAANSISKSEVLNVFK